MKKNEVIDFVDSLFLMMYMTRDKRYIEIDRRVHDFGLIKACSVMFTLRMRYIISVTANNYLDKPVHIRLVMFDEFKDVLDHENKESIKEEFNLERVNVTKRSSNNTINVICQEEECKEFLIWLQKEIDSKEESLKIKV